MDYRKELNLIKEVTPKIYAETVDETITSELKDVQDLVTSTDLHMETSLVDIIKKAFPGDHFHTEEFNHDTILKDRTWIIDPIDGTSNYAAGLPMFVVQVALYDKGDIVMSYMHAPALDKTWYAIKGEGAFVNDVRYRTEDRPDTTSIMALVGMTHDNVMRYYERMLGLAVEEHHKLRMFGSVGLELALASEGMFNLFYTAEKKIWDVYPGLLLLREAGAILLNEQGKPHTLSDDHLFICKNKKAESQLLKKVLTT